MFSRLRITKTMLVTPLLLLFLVACQNGEEGKTDPTVDPTQELGTIIGQVFNKTMEDHGNTTVALESLENSGIMVAQTKTDSQGNFRFQSINFGNYKLYAFNENSLEKVQTRNLTINSNQKVTRLSSIEFIPVGAIIGNLTLDTKSNHRGIFISLEGTNYISNTDAEGAYSFQNIPVGNYNISVNYQGYTHPTTFPVTVHQGETTAIAQKVLSIPGTIGLVKVTTEAPGTNCINGGQKVDTGIDQNENGLLDTTEIKNTSYICHGTKGDQGSTGEQGKQGDDGLNSLVKLSEEPQGTNCAAGGKKITTGTDKNNNAVLDTNEVDHTSYICHGTTGSIGDKGATGEQGEQGEQGESGLNSLVNVSEEPAGTNCTAGGKKIETGIDKDNSGTLETDEVEHTSYVCDGLQGSTGDKGEQGSSGLNSLVKVSDEPVGTNCISSGKKIETGIDRNSNGTLETGEVEQTSYVCDGAQGTAGKKGDQGDSGLNSFVKTTVEPSGTNCAAGGQKIETGIDKNNNGTPEADEVEHTSYVCNGAQGTTGNKGETGDKGDQGDAGLNSLVNISNEPTGPNCAAGGKKIEAGIDNNSNNTLEADEVDHTSYVCDGARGETGNKGDQGDSGLNSLIKVSDEPMGSNCLPGGKKIETGIDDDNNGTLEITEVDHISYVCNGGQGVTGAKGDQGDLGFSSLVQVSEEPNGSNCTAGGKKIATGVDENRNGILEVSEIDHTNYVCNGMQGTTGEKGETGEKGDAGLNSLVKVSDELPGTNCTTGGKKIQTGIDEDNSGTLETGEIDHTGYVCNGSQGTTGATGDTGTKGDQGDKGEQGDAGFNSLVKISDEPISGNCAAGGKKIETGIDASNNGILENIEVDHTSYVCNGSQGTTGAKGDTGEKGNQGDKGEQGDAGFNSLVKISDEPISGNCAAGGKKIETGIDDSNNGILENIEVDHTSYVCNGSQGATGGKGDTGAKGDQGDQGASGFNSLVKVSDESAGGNCTSGGKKIETGIDDSGNGTLENIEVDHTSYVCHGIQGTTGEKGDQGDKGEQGDAGFNSLVNVTNEPAGTNCQYGGKKIETGVDNGQNGAIANDNVLQTGEVQSTEYLCIVDVLPLKVITKTPVNSSAKPILPDHSITVTFNKVIDPMTLNSDTLLLTVQGETEFIDADLSYNGTTITLTPQVPLQYGESYSVILSESIRDTVGNVLQADISERSWNFKVYQPGDNGFKTIDTGGYHTCAILMSGQVKCWGLNDKGQLGLGHTKNRGDNTHEIIDSLPVVNLGTGKTAIAISTGSHHSCAVLNDGTVKCWGSQEQGQLGLETIENIGDSRNEMGDNLPTVALGIGRTATAITTGESHSCALLDNGEVKCWGGNAYGQLGLEKTEGHGGINGNMGEALPPIALGTDRTATTIASRSNHTCAILDNGQVKCWGNNEYGKLGLGDTDNRGDSSGDMGDNLPFTDLGTGRTATKIFVGLSHSCAILDTDQLKCWGNNSGGKLGLGNGNTYGDDPNEMGDNLPTVDVGTGRTAISVSIGGGYSCATLDNGELKCWGGNRIGQLGLGLKSGSVGTIAGQMGDNLKAVDLGIGKTAIAVTSGFNTSCVLLTSKQAKCWGDNTYGQLGQGDNYRRGDNSGEMGDNLKPINSYIANTVAKISTRESHTCALLDSGQIKCWGSNNHGQLGLENSYNRGASTGEMGNNLPTVDLGIGKTATDIATGDLHTCALLTDGQVKCWGFNEKGQLGLEDLESRGLLYGDMGDKLPTVSLGTDRTATAIATGNTHTCALLDNGQVKCWGWNEYGQLGITTSGSHGDETNEMGDNLPAIALGAGRTATAITTGFGHTCALLDNGQVKCWGSNNHGQLGVTDAASLGKVEAEMGDNLPAVSLGTDRTATAITAGSYHTCALLDNGQVKCWGGNSYGVLGQGDVNSRGKNSAEMGDNLPAINLGASRTAITIQAGQTHMCAILDNKQLKCWGSNQYGLLGAGDFSDRGDAQHRGDNPDEMGDNLPAIDLGTGRTATGLAGGSTACARLDNRQIKCWGANYNGYLGVGDTNNRGDEPNEMGDRLPYINLGKNH